MRDPSRPTMQRQPMNFFEAVTKRLVEAWKSDESSGRRSAFTCRCERPVYFNNSLCLGCQAQLGYEPELGQVRALEPTAEPGVWKLHGEEEPATVWKRCENFDSPAGCNWLVRADEEEPLCRSCRLNNTIPNLDAAENGLWWRKIENAKRRLTSQLLRLGLPVAS
jgi:hypothetical protein